jgi:SAM-dependent methyltransferase
MTTRQHHWNTRYRSGNTPWDSGITPPELTEFWASDRLPPDGLAIDLGCGTGTNVTFLAGLGLHAVGVEFSGIALKRAMERLGTLGPDLDSHIDLVQADVARLPMANAGASYIVDIGCLHGVPQAERPAYGASVIDNLLPGGYFHLFASDRVLDPPADNPEMAWRGMTDDEVETLFSPKLAVVEIIRGDPDHFPCRWYLLQKR